VGGISRHVCQTTWVAFLDTCVSLRGWYVCTGYQEKIPFVKSAPIEADDASKSKKKQSAGAAGGGGKKSTKGNTAEHPGGDIANAVADGVNSVTLQS